MCINTSLQLSRSAVGIVHPPSGSGCAGANDTNAWAASLAIAIPRFGFRLIDGVFLYALRVRVCRLHANPITHSHYAGWDERHVELFIRSAHGGRAIARNYSLIQLSPERTRARFGAAVVATRHARTRPQME